MLGCTLPIRVLTETLADTGRLDVDRVVTLPLLSGPALDGLPHDPDGFLPVDRHGRVAGAPDVYAAGDAVNFEIKFGGLACLQADAAAETIAYAQRRPSSRSSAPGACATSSCS